MELVGCPVRVDAVGSGGTVTLFVRDKNGGGGIGLQSVVLNNAEARALAAAIQALAEGSDDQEVSFVFLGAEAFSGPDRSLDVSPPK